MRHRQLSARTLLAGMMLTVEDRRPAYLTEVHAALTSLPAEDQKRLRVIEDWRAGLHLLTCRQTEYTFSLVTDALSKDQPDGAPSGDLAAVCDDLLEASIPGQYKDPASPQAPASLAADWTTSRPGPGRRGTAAPNVPTPRPHGGTATATCPGPRARCSSATSCQPRS